jgi:N-acetylmuramoyl-L-alanine amidase/Mannosyl-glycoprotein endo-beta-N-acetylglucosaminidase
MSTPSKQLKDLVTIYRNETIEFPGLKSVSLAQWIEESGWGSSALCKEYNNFAGIKWRNEMKPYAVPVSYEAHDGVALYCNFKDQSNFIKGYWAFLNRKPYAGWRNHTADPQDFIEFIGPIWAQDPKYSENVLNLLGAAEDLLAAPTPATRMATNSLVSDHVCETSGAEDFSPSPMAATVTKPRVDRVEHTTHKSSRNGAVIDHIVIHYTTSRNIEGTIEHFKNGSPRTSAHYIVGRDGALVQMVADSERAWHAGNTNMNAHSIGIEHVAKIGDEITDEQAKKSSSLIRWLMQEYSVNLENLIPHCCVHPTSCCGDLFKAFGGGANKSCQVQKDALHAWFAAVPIA